MYGVVHAIALLTIVFMIAAILYILICDDNDIFK